MYLTGLEEEGVVQQGETGPESDGEYTDLSDAAVGEFGAMGMTETYIT